MPFVNTGPAAKKTARGNIILSFWLPKNVKLPDRKITT